MAATTDPPPRRKFQVFSAGERSLQRSFARWRQTAFGPLLSKLASLGVTPDQLSILGVLVTAFIPLGLVVDPAWIVVGYALHLFCDGLDGALARHLHRTSPRGEYLDLVADHAVMLVTVLALQACRLGDPFWCLSYTITYLLVVVHLAALNAQGTPPRLPVMRSKYPLFLLVVLLAYDVLSVQWLDGFFILFSVYGGVVGLALVSTFRQTLGGQSRNDGTDV